MFEHGTCNHSLHVCVCLCVCVCVTQGSMTNLLPDGGASMGWHGDPAVLKQ